MRTAYFWDITRPVMVIPYRRFGTTYRSHLQSFNHLKMGPTECPETSAKELPLLAISWPLNMGPMDCPETSVRNYHYSLRNNPEDRSSHLLRGGNLKSPKRTSHSFCDDLYSFCPWVRNVPGALSTGTERLGRKPDQSLPLSADVTNGWRYALKPPTCIHGKDKDDFTFTMGLQHSANSASPFLSIGATFLSGFQMIPCIFHVSNLQSFPYIRRPVPSLI